MGEKVGGTQTEDYISLEGCDYCVHGDIELLWGSLDDMKEIHQFGTLSINAGLE